MTISQFSMTSFCSNFAFGTFFLEKVRKYRLSELMLNFLMLLVINNGINLVKCKAKLTKFHDFLAIFFFSPGFPVST